MFTKNGEYKKLNKNETIRNLKNEKKNTTKERDRE
jgi:hypothetical protein